MLRISCPESLDEQVSAQRTWYMVDGLCERVPENGCTKNNLKILRTETIGNYAINQMNQG